MERGIARRPGRRNAGRGATGATIDSAGRADLIIRREVGHGIHRVLRITLAVAVLGTSRSPARADILVGVAAPLTGPYEWSGEQAQHGVELAAEELNAVGGLLGQRVTLAFADDYCDPEQAVAAAR